jgi:RNA polymerase sigma factor (sigma-70 family)
VSLPPFQRFLDSHRDEVHRFLVGAVGPNEAEDCFQETFIAALRAYPRLRPGSDLRAWVLTIARRKAIDAHRARARRAVPVGDAPDVAAPEAPAPRDDAVWAPVRALPAKQRAAVVLRVVCDMAYADVARVMECSEEAARRSVHEGLRKLRGVTA